MELCYSTEALYARGKYLTEVIDKIQNKATINDIEELPKDRGGRYVVTWGPSSGKTTAIRQFIVHNTTNGCTGVVATKLIDDAKSLRYDIISQLYYLNPDKNYLNSVMSLVVSFTSEDKDITIDSLKLSAWVICTHERLFIEPSSILFTRDVARLVVYQNNIDVILRKYLFVDEYPSSLYKSFDTDQVYMLPIIEDKAGIKNITDRFTRSILISKYIDTVYDKYDKTRRKNLDTALVDSLPTPTNQSMIIDVNRGIDTVPSKFSKERIKFFTSVLVEKYNILNSPNDDNKGFITYSIADLPAITTYIFDGTGDLLFNNSKLYKTISNPKFSRNLSLIDNKVHLVNNDLSRKMTDEELLPKSIKIIDKVLNEIPTGEKLLVYYWKSSKGISDERNSTLLSDLRKYYKGRIKFIYYQSGLEKGTSKFSNINNALILGQFFIPNYVINTLNQITESESTNTDYTISLLIQFIYRTSARHNKSIRLFIDDNYGVELIKYLMSKFSLNSDYEIISSVTEENLNLTSKKLSERNNLFSALSSRYTPCSDGYYHVFSTDLSTILGYKKIDNAKIKHKLVTLKVNYKCIDGDNHYKSEYIIKYN